MRTAHVRSRLIPLSVCAILVLAACGDDDSVSSPTDPTLQPPVAVNVAGSGGDIGDGALGRTAQSETAVAADTDMSTGLMPAFGGYVFEVGEGLPALPTNSTGYHFPAGVTVDAAEVARVAAALGVEGEPQEVTSDTVNLTTWRVGPDDGTAPALFVSNDGQLSWYYSTAWATAAVEGCGVSGSDGSVTGSVIEVDAATGVAVAEPAPADDTVAPDQPPASPPPAIEECPTPEPPAGVPTAEEATTKANELLTALGEDPAAFELETYADEWNASVAAYPTTDGVTWPSGYSFSFAGAGALQYASGTLAEPVATGPYPLVDVDTAIARLSDQNGMWGYGGVDVLAVDARETEAAAPDEVARDRTADDEQTMPIDDGSIPPTPEPIVATLVDVKADLWWVWDTDSSVWLLPAYTFTDTEGNEFTVPAVTDEYMIVVEPTIEPQPVPAEPLDPVVVDPPTSDPATSGVAPGDPAVLDQFVGVPLPEFEEVAKRYGFTTRVARQDGVDLAGTADFSESRVNVAVEGDVVTEILSIG
ncbi:MAG TPA: hypothetical protein VFV63_20440 [Ilumatobacteraceae bacterium]|nr:hypothetical protein [Ilumatobacteraceae bacterium]